MVKIRLGILFWIIMLTVSAMIFVASLWNIDWAMWNKNFWLYYPIPGYWNVPAKNTAGGLGFWVNIQYYQLCASYILGIIASFKIGKEIKR